MATVDGKLVEARKRLGRALLAGDIEEIDEASAHLRTLTTEGLPLLINVAREARSLRDSGWCLAFQNRLDAALRELDLGEESS